MDGLDDARELDQCAIAHEFDDAPLMFSNLRVYDVFAMRVERSQSTRLVSLHQAGIINNVGGQDRGEAALHRAPLSAIA